MHKRSQRRYVNGELGRVPITLYKTGSGAAVAVGCGLLTADLGECLLLLLRANPAKCPPVPSFPDFFLPSA